MSTCEYCHRPTERGEYYTCYYGSTNSSSYRSGNITTINTLFSIKGSNEAFICDHCVMNYLIKDRLWSMLLTIVGVPALVYGVSIIRKDVWLALLIIACGILLTFVAISALRGLGHYLSCIRKNDQAKVEAVLRSPAGQEAGDELAKRISKSKIRDYRDFYTRAEWKSFKERSH